jgi:hypothetical protein
MGLARAWRAERRRRKRNMVVIVSVTEMRGWMVVGLFGLNTQDDSGVVGDPSGCLYRHALVRPLQYSFRSTDWINL